MECINLEIIKKVNEDEFIQLYIDANWWQKEYYEDTSFIQKIVENSFLFIGASNSSGRMIGMGRVISDTCSDAYIQDVVVLKEYRGNGIGKNIINYLLSELKKYNIDWIGLIGEPGTQKFYEKLGFNKLENYIPMVLE